MPHTPSAKKNLRKNRKRRLRNRSVRGDIKSQIKELMTAKDSNPDQFEKELRLAVKKLDKAAAKRIIHPNMASRKKSQLAKLANRKASSAAK